MRKSISILSVLMFVFTLAMPAQAGVREGFSSLVLPGTGQVMNGQASDGKTKVIAVVEVAALTTTAILGGFVGGPVIWAGLGPLIANHVYAAADATFTPAPYGAQGQYQQTGQFPEYGSSSYQSQNYSQNATYIPTSSSY